jgi:hypothetical protein
VHEEARVVGRIGICRTGGGGNEVKVGWIVQGVAMFQRCGELWREGELVKVRDLRQ